jgi:hypothetical protein
MANQVQLRSRGHRCVRVSGSVSIPLLRPEEALSDEINRSSGGPSVHSPKASSARRPAFLNGKG